MNKKLSKILWIHSHPNPYQNYLFNEVNDNFNLEVLFTDEVLNTHPWDESFDTNFDFLYLKNSLFSSFKRSFARYDLRIVNGWHNFWMLFVLIIYSILGVRYAIFTDTPSLKKRNVFKIIFHKTILQFIINRAEFVFVTGELGVKRFVEKYCNQKKVINFPFATNLSFFKPILEKKNRETLHFLSIGRLVNSHKAFDLSILAFSKIFQRDLHFTFKYYIVGEGPDRENLEFLINSLGLSENVFLLGWKGHSDILNLLADADVFLHPSHFDPFPNVVLEAMACGLPIIGSDAAGSVVDRVIHKKNGLIFPDNHIDELVDCLNYSIINRESLRSWGGDSRLIAEKWSVQYNINILKNIFQLN